MADTKVDPFKEQVDKRFEYRGEEHSFQVEEFDRGDGRGKRKVLAIQPMEGGGGAQRFDFGSEQAKKFARMYPDLNEWNVGEAADNDEVAQLRARVRELEARQSTAPAAAAQDASAREAAARANQADRGQAGLVAAPAEPQTSPAAGPPTVASGPSSA
jgi:hypothetical protein